MDKFPKIKTTQKPRKARRRLQRELINAGIKIGLSYSTRAYLNFSF